ncbi:sulfotransferase [Paraglaciecola marina]|uniref:sulfotransferase n=1 Tax=Paraglaciecola marina TaxID=2500157 RepID=UPI00105E2328|nr:sulfotransferase [Paraglaciecola marina]
MDVSRKVIFDIGFNKCGTRTVNAMMKKAGYVAKHWRGGELALDVKYAYENNDIPLKQFPKTDFFSDMVSEKPGSFFEAYKCFKFLAESYPNSLFIITERNVDAWIKSRINHGNGHSVNCYKKQFGFSTLDEVEKFWREDWESHRANVDAYFSNEERKHRLLKLNIETPDFKAISTFLDKKITSDYWGHEGKTKK